MKRILAILFCLIFVISCGGGSSDDNNGGGNTSPVVDTDSGNDSDALDLIVAKTITGTAATGTPIVGIVNVKGANGNTATALIDANGTFTLDVSLLTPPYILFAEGTASGQTILLFSIAVGNGEEGIRANITPLTDLIAANALNAPPETSFAGWTSSKVNGESLQNAELTVRKQLAPVIAGAGLATDLDLMSKEFKTDGTGMDALLDMIEYKRTGSTAVVTNILSGNSFSVDTSGTVETGFSAAEVVIVQQGVVEKAQCDALLDRLETLFVDSFPTPAQINQDWAPYVADDFLNSGRNKVQELTEWATGNGPGVGIQFWCTLKGNMAPQEYNQAAYLGGKWVWLNYKFEDESGRMLTSVVFDGVNWLWHGDRMWVESNEMVTLALMEVSTAGTRKFFTGWSFGLNDDMNFSYDQGVRSAIITGPGLPEKGVTMFHSFPGTGFSLYNSDRWTRYFSPNDQALAGILENSTYTINLYAQEAETVSLNDVPVNSFTKIIPSKPLLNAELSENVFPTLTSPTSHAISATNIPGTLEVGWINPIPPSTVTGSFAYLSRDDSNGAFKEVASEPAGAGETSVTVDTSIFAEAPFSQSNLGVRSFDLSGRTYDVFWNFGN